MVVKEDDEVMEEKVADIDARPVWEKMDDHVKDLSIRVARHFEDKNDEIGWKPPMIKTPPQPTHDEWLGHQLTHTPFAAWCKHCNAGTSTSNSESKIGS